MKRNNNNRKLVKKQSEVKICDSAQLVFIPSTSGNFITLCNIAQGTAYNERVGTTVAPMRLHFRARLNLGVPLSGYNQTYLRVIILQDRQQVDSTSPLSSQVITPIEPEAAKNWFYRNRFNIISDEIHTLDIYHPSKWIDRKFAISGSMDYSSSGSTSICKNGLYALILQDNSVYPASLDYWFRLYYTDA
jgi:hypothetical protein